MINIKAHTVAAAKTRRMTRDSHFVSLLAAAAHQPQPQRLLFVFAGAELPDRPSADQRRRFAAGSGGALSPIMCVDKAPADLPDFESLAAESRRAGPPWSVVFAASLAGADGHPPAPGQIEAALEKMVSAVLFGSVGQFAAFDAAGEPIKLS